MLARKTLEKQRLHFSRSALLHMKTRVGLKYFVTGCRSENYAKVMLQNKLLILQH